MSQDIIYDRVIGPSLVTAGSDQTTTTLSIPSETAPTTLTARTYGNIFVQVSSPGLTTETTAATAVDSQSNIYLLVKEVLFAGFALDVFSHTETTPDVATTLTVTHQPSRHRIILGDEWYNIVSTAEHVTSGLASSPVAQVDIGEFHVGNKSWLVYAVLAIGGSAYGDSITIPTGWNLLHDTGSDYSDGHDVRLVVCYQTATDRQKIEFNPVISTARVWGAVMMAYKKKN
jgi:hypothetical protein